MTEFFDRLDGETAAGKAEFVSIPLIQHATKHGVSKETYLAFLEQAYHHVKHTCNLLGLAASRCTADDKAYQDALFEYINEEKGHELWILDDIRNLGGDADAVRNGQPSPACAAMVGYAYYAIEHISPYCLLGMVHVLEGMSVLLAHKAAAAIAETFDVDLKKGGFSYLTSHGSLDIEHVAFFKGLVNQLDDPEKQKVVIDTARVIYRLYGDIFRGIPH